MKAAMDLMVIMVVLPVVPALYGAEHRFFPANVCAVRVRAWVYTLLWWLELQWCGLDERSAGAGFSGSIVLDSACALLSRRVSGLISAHEISSACGQDFARRALDVGNCRLLGVGADAVGI